MDNIRMEIEDKARQLLSLMTIENAIKLCRYNSKKAKNHVDENYWDKVKRMIEVIKIGY
jgi:hypothetical protein